MKIDTAIKILENPIVHVILTGIATMAFGWYLLPTIMKKIRKIQEEYEKEKQEEYEKEKNE